jgi:AcrR family transcriptional regulator
MMQYGTCVTMGPDRASPSLRQRKRRQTRQALVEAAASLFDRQGYDETTIAEIAAAAGISTRSFFSHFASKEEILFPDTDSRVRAAADVIAARRPGEGPAEVLVRAAARVLSMDTAMASRMAVVRIRLIAEVPAVRGRCLRVTFGVQREVARRLLAAFPDDLDEVGAAALAGAITGALAAALAELFADPARARDLLSEQPRLRAELSRVTRLALAPWLPSPP